MSTPPDAKALEMAELQKSYAEKVLSTSRFIASTLIILIVLAVVVEQELREHRREEQDQSKRVLDTTKKLRGAKKELTGSFDKLKKFLKSEAYEVKVLDASTNSASGSWMPTSRKCRLDFLCERLENLPKPVLSVKEPDDLEKLRGGETGLKEELDKLEGGRDKIDGKNKKLQTEQLQLLDRGIGLYRNYARLYGDYSSSARKLLATIQEKKILNASKRSIPTPFGSFEVQPRLALFALAFATLFSYFVFLSSVYRIRALAKTYYSGHTGGKAITGSDPAPFWLYSTEPGLSEVLTWRTQTRLTAWSSLALHAGWILLALWLVWECLLKWDSIESLLFDYRSIWVYALAACLLIATLLAVWQFVPGRLRQASRIVNNVGGRVSALANRRAFLRGAVTVAGIYVLGGGLYYWLSRQSNPITAKPCGLRSSELGIDSAPWVVVNRRTRVVHHEYICSAHLPAEKNRVTLDKVGAELCVHASFQARILEDLASDELDQLSRLISRRQSLLKPRLDAAHRFDAAHLAVAAVITGLDLSRVEGKDSKVKLSKEDRQLLHKEKLAEAERGFPYLVKAIELNPLSYHLYDKLIRAYGRLSRYQDIANLLDGAQHSVAHEIEGLNQSPPTPVTTRRLKQLERAKKEFEIRVASVKRKENTATALRQLRKGSSPK